MKVVCKYCGSYVEADENMKCPSCLAELGSAVQQEEARLEEQEEAEQQREAEEKAQESKDEHISEVIEGITSVATAFFTGRSSSSNTAFESDGRPPEPPDGRHGPDGRPPEPPDGRRSPHDGGFGNSDGFGTRPSREVGREFGDHQHHHSHPGGPGGRR